MVENAVLGVVLVEADPPPPPLEHAASNARPAPAATSVRAIDREAWPSIRSDSLRSRVPPIRACPGGARRVERAPIGERSEKAARQLRQEAGWSARSAPAGPIPPSTSGRRPRRR